jgi:mono/diheme cytochrome c family protein
MSPVKLSAAVAACFALLAAYSPSRSHLLQDVRSAPSDLEIVGATADNAPGTVRYVSYQRLLALPQVTVPVRGDENFTEIPQEKLSVTGVYLDVLKQALGVLPDSDLVTALCSDGYRDDYTREYIQTHRPIFALKINGLPVETWVAQTHNEDPGAYFITHSSFTPSYNVLSFQEMSKIPTMVTRLEFGTAQPVYNAIAPHGKNALDSQVMDGFRIAQNHCYRCHNMGSYGGTKAGKTWQTLANYAATSPVAFERYIRNPKSINPKSPMPSNPRFDEPTAKALQAYFQTFAAGAH